MAAPDARYVLHLTPEMASEAMAAVAQRCREVEAGVHEVLSVGDFGRAAMLHRRLAALNEVRAAIDTEAQRLAEEVPF